MMTGRANSHPGESSESETRKRPGANSARTDQDASTVGILMIATYFPKTFVSQAKLEEFDKVEPGKYTKGLMQDKMGFCTDLEDINSIALTVTKRLIERSGVSMDQVGYLEVGTETILDKSKSVKSTLMDLFEASGNSDIEAVDTTNACYGGTAALFHALDHCTSANWDGRLAVVVAADIAVYGRGCARPTGGCGAVAMLIGPNAPIVFDSIRATHMANVYDFYKPNSSSEYPAVDGKLSLQAYMTALDKCYQVYRRKYANTSRKGRESFSLIDQFDGILMHSPYCKLVRKAFARLLFNEFNCMPTEPRGNERFVELLRQIPRERLNLLYATWTEPIGETCVSPEQVLTQSSGPLYQEKTAQSLFLSNQVGNMYTASLYSCLVSYLTSRPLDRLVDTSLLFFSYGSGLAASMFSARIGHNVRALEVLLEGIQDIRMELQERLEISPEEFTAHLEHQERTFALANRIPTGRPEGAVNSFGAADRVMVERHIWPGAYYLTLVDEKFRRFYSRLECSSPAENATDPA